MSEETKPTPQTGIDTSLFEQEHEGKTKGLISGRDLNIKINKNHIKISDGENPNLFFEAKVNGGKLLFAAHTKGFDGDENKKHPDLYATKLMHQSMEFFQNQGTEIHTWMGVWSGNGNLTDMYDEFVQNTKNGMSESQAALSTTEGMLADQYNFSHVTQINWIREIRECVVYFSKEK